MRTLLFLIATILLAACNSVPTGSQFKPQDTAALGAKIGGANRSVKRASERAKKVTQTLSKPTPLQPAEQEQARRDVVELSRDLGEAESDLVAAENERERLRKADEERTTQFNQTVIERDKARSGLAAMTTDRNVWRDRYRSEFGLWARIKSHFWSTLIGIALGVGGMIALWLTGKLAKVGARLGVKATTGI